MGAVLVYRYTGEFLLFSYPYMELWRSSSMFRSFVYRYTRTQPKNALNHHHKNFHIYARPCITPCLSFFCNLLVHFVKFFKSFTTEVIKNIIGILSRFISWDGWLYMGPGRVRFQGEVEVLYDSRISCTWHVVFAPYFRHLCLVLDGFR